MLARSSTPRSFPNSARSRPFPRNRRSATPPESPSGDELARGVFGSSSSRDASVHPSLLLTQSRRSSAHFDVSLPKLLSACEAHFKSQTTSVLAGCVGIRTDKRARARQSTWLVCRHPGLVACPAQRKGTCSCGVNGTLSTAGREKLIGPICGIIGSHVDITSRWRGHQSVRLPRQPYGRSPAPSRQTLFTVMMTLPRAWPCSR
jgi:hypothetical protein